MRKKTNLIIMGLVVILGLALVLTGCGKNDSEGERYDKLTNEVWRAVDGDYGYRIEFWPNGVCYIIKTYGENWVGVAKRNYTIDDSYQFTIGNGEFISELSTDYSSMTITMPDGETWNFTLTESQLSAIDKDFKKYDELFKGMSGPPQGSNTSTNNDTNSNYNGMNNANKTTTVSHPDISPNANGKYEYNVESINFESDINVWDYVDENNDFDLKSLLEDWGFDDITVQPNGKINSARSESRDINLAFFHTSEMPMNDYGLTPVKYWELINKSFYVNIGVSDALDSMYSVNGSEWGMSEDQIELLAYFIQYGASNKSDPNYKEDFGSSIWTSNNYRLP